MDANDTTLNGRHSGCAQTHAPYQTLQCPALRRNEGMLVIFECQHINIYLQRVAAVRLLHTNGNSERYAFDRRRIPHAAHSAKLITCARCAFNDNDTYVVGEFDHSITDLGSYLISAEMFCVRSNRWASPTLCLVSESNRLVSSVRRNRELLDTATGGRLKLGFRP